VRRHKISRRREVLVKRIVLVSLASMLVTAVPSSAQAPRPDAVPVVVTAGEGVVNTVPDRAWVTITAESRAVSPREAQKLNAQAMSAVMQQLRGLGLPDEAVRTRAYDLQPQFDYKDGRQTLRGYLARNSIEVRLDDITRVGEVIDVAVSSGATNVSGVRFDLKNREEVEREALRRAVADARARADAAAAGAGMTVTGVLRIDEQRAGISPPQPMMARMGVAEMAADAAPPISPGEHQVRVAVTLTATIK
jgi:uncharacterized protein